MKKNLLICTIIAFFASLALSSYEHGPAYEGGINRTGSQGGVANCAGSGCHSANVPTTVVGITVTNTSGTPVTEYIPGTTYNVIIRGHNTAIGTSSEEFGFQLSAVLGSTAQAGIFTVPSGTNLRVTPLAGLQIVEHKKELDDSATNYAVARFTWTAPAAGSGPVKFHGIVNLLGGEGDDDGDDEDDEDDDEDEDVAYPNVAPIVTLTEHGGSTNSVNNISADAIAIFPNPCTDVLSIDVKVGYDVRIYNASGFVIYIGKVSTAANTIDTKYIPAGVYHMELNEGTNRIVKTIVKL